MGLIERAKSLNIVSSKTARAAAIFLKVKEARDGNVKMRFAESEDPSVPPSLEQINDELAKAEALVAEALVELKKV